MNWFCSISTGIVWNKYKNLFKTYIFIDLKFFILFVRTDKESQEGDEGLSEVGQQDESSLGYFKQ